jgi:hypothetical protein
LLGELDRGVGDHDVSGAYREQGFGVIAAVAALRCGSNGRQIAIAALAITEKPAIGDR